MRKTHVTRRTTHMSVAAIASVGILLSAGTFAHAADAPTLTIDTPSQSSAVSPNKIDVMGLWAHPDDDAGFTTPCGVWHDLYGVRCGIIMASRGEGGSNSVGSEAGPDLGLRRENEDRTSHYRSGTVDIFNLDRVDFYYNTSAPLTEQVWDHDETLRRTVRVIRETQPEILVGWPSALKGGHGNHQYAQGRMIWEAAAAAADPQMYPEQLSGDNAVGTWQVKKILAGAKTTGDGGISGPSCNTGFVPASDNPFTVVGTWTGYDSPYSWLEGNLAGIAAGTPKTWAQVGREGGRAHPTQERVMQKDVWEPTCQRYGVAQSLVPMQPNGSSDSERDDAVLFGATVQDPGGMPLGSLFYPTVSDHFQAAGVPFTLTANIQLADSSTADGTLELLLPEGWSYSGMQQIAGIADSDMHRAEFTVTPSDTAAPGIYKIGLQFDDTNTSAYNDTRVEIVPAIEGRILRAGLEAEYEQWANTKGSFVEGRSDPITQIGVGESISIPVEVTNRTNDDQSGEVNIQVPNGFTLDADSKSFTDLPAKSGTQLDFVLTHTDTASSGNTTESLAITTTTPISSSKEEVAVRLVPTTVIPELPAAPSLTGNISEYTGADLNISTRWEGKACDPEGIDCGEGSVAKVGWHDDALYIYSRVTDDVAGGAVTPDRCFGHWITDSVELLFDPIGGSIDTSPTFKLGIFPFTDDGENWNGNGINGPCWSRDADNHQGFSSGPLADTILGAPNAPGVQVTSQAVIDDAGNYVDGHYVVEAKIPFSVLPASIVTSAAPTGDLASNTVDPQYLGMNITPYDSDNQVFVGKSRMAWSAFDSQQSEPLRWGHAYLENYQGPGRDNDETPTPLIPNTALTGVESPQTIYQSATRGVTISGLTPTSSLRFLDASLTAEQITLPYETQESGTLRAYLWKGDPAYIPVWTSSCPDDIHGFEACSPDDGAAAPWAPNMGGRLVTETQSEVEAGSGELTIALDEETYASLDEDTMILVSFEESAPVSGIAGDGVDAWAFSVVKAETPVTPEPGPDPKPEPEPGVDPPTSPGPEPEPGKGGAAPSENTPGQGLATTGATVAAFIVGALALSLLGFTGYRYAQKKKSHR